MSKNSGDELEILRYFVGFWWFLSSPTFRAGWIEEFKTENLIEKAFSLFEATLSIFFGVVVPLLLACLVYSSF